MRMIRCWLVLRQWGAMGQTGSNRLAPPGAWWLLLITLLTPRIAQATNETTLARAANAMRQGREAASKIIETRQHFREAADACAELYRDGVASPELFLLWGNAEVLADRPPRAIWAYHAGLRLAPNHRVLREHLAYARNRVAAAQTARTTMPSEAGLAWLPGPWTTFLAASLAFSLTCAAAAVWRVRHRWGWSALLALALTLIASVSCALSILRECAESQSPRVVVAEADTPMTLGNGPSYAPHPESPRLPAGAEARVLHRRGGWLRIELPGGDVGWIPAAKGLVVPTGR
jgi:hypothetical protein